MCLVECCFKSCEVESSVSLIDKIFQSSKHQTNDISINSNIDLMKWLTNSMKIMDGDVSGVSNMYDHRKHYRAEIFHYKHINKRINQLLEKSKRSQISNVSNNARMYSYLNNIWYIKNILNNTIFYHVECPSEKLNLFTIRDEKKEKYTTITKKCEIFRWIVHKALNVFKENMFEFVELPSEVMNDNLFVIYNNKKILTRHILNFAFVDPRHHVYYYSDKQYLCTKFTTSEISSGVAHLIGSSIHLNANNVYCITEIPYPREVLAQKYGCENDLFFVLLHELSHFFISSCHSDVEFLKEYTTQRSLDESSYKMMMQTWKSENTSIHCTFTSPFTTTTPSNLTPTQPQTQTLAQAQTPTPTLPTPLPTLPPTQTPTPPSTTTQTASQTTTTPSASPTTSWSVVTEGKFSILHLY